MSVGKFIMIKISDCGMMSVLESVILIPYCLCWNSKAFFCWRSGRGGGKLMQK